MNLENSGQKQNGESNSLAVAIVGGGPAGLTAAHRLLALEAISKVTLVEQGPANDWLQGQGTFSIRLGQRAKDVMADLPGDPWEAIGEKGFKDGESVVSANRAVIREVLFTSLLEEHGQTGRFDAEFDSRVEQLEAAERKLTLSGGKEVKYDVLLIADGVHATTTLQAPFAHLQPVKRATTAVIKTASLPPLPPGFPPFVALGLGLGGELTAEPASVALTLFPKQDASFYAVLKFHYTDGLLSFSRPAQLLCRAVWG